MHVDPPSLDVYNLLIPLKPMAINVRNDLGSSAVVI
jgi:hypothetical protein